MIFFFKKKPIVLDCYARDERVASVAPLKNTQHFLPDWWKQIPKAKISAGEMYPSPTMRHCVGFTNWYTNGFTIPMWCDLALTVGPKNQPWYRYQYADGESHATHHEPSQHNWQYPANKFQHIKLTSPWFISCNEHIKFMFVEHTWNMVHFNSIRVLPGIIDFKYQPSLNINFLVPRTDNEQHFIIPLMEPLVQIVPMSNRGIKLNIHTEPSEYKKIKDKFAPSVFIKEYATVSKIRKQNGSK